MNWDRRTLALATVIALSACADEHQPTSPSAVVVSDHGRPSGGASPVVAIVGLGFAVGADVDEQGQAVGWDLPNGIFHARLWAPAVTRGTVGTITDLPELSGGQSYALGLNEAHQIAGGSADATAFRAVVWDGTALHALGEPTGAIGSSADDISDQLADQSRLVAGRVDLATVSRPAVWRISGTAAGFSVLSVALLPGLRPDGAGQAIAASANGVVVGDAETTGSDLPSPVRWNFSGSTWSLTALGLLPNQTFGQVLDVNSSGIAVGHNGSAGAGCSHGAVWPPDGVTPTVLQDLAGGSCSFAWAINDAGEITGSARDARGRNHAVLWRPAGSGGYSILNLGELRGTRSSEGRGLNEPQPDGTGGQILEVVGVSGSSRGTLWKVRLP
jgi:uncharacterized membrane protein